jgi:hypothetical protein
MTERDRRSIEEVLLGAPTAPVAARAVGKTLDIPKERIT